MRTLEKSNRLFQSAAEVMPLGVSSNYRYWGDEDTRYIDRGKGAYLWDVDGNRYLDYRLGYGPVILGHSDDRVDRAVAQALRLGQSFAMSTPIEQEVARKMVTLCPGVEMVRFATSGTEATMHALRLARAYTNREKFIMFEGQYHGLHDSVMWASNIGEGAWMSHRRSPVIYPMSSGVPNALRDLVTLLPFNDFEILEQTINQAGHEVAAIFVEPIMGNCGGIMPEPGWLEHIRKLCDDNGIVMIIDEVKTGFRIATGGAQEVFGVTADLATYAKALGNGYPVAALGGKGEIMSMLGEGVSHGGTFSGNRIGMAAANATLDILMNTNALETVVERGLALQNAISEILGRTGRPFVISGHPSMFIFWFAEEAPKEYRDWRATDHSLYDEIAAGLIARGVMPEPDSREPWFLCAALSHDDIAETANKLEDIVREVLG